MVSDNVQDDIFDMIADLADMIGSRVADSKLPSPDWDWDSLSEQLHALFGLKFKLSDEEKEEVNPAELVEKLTVFLNEAYGVREKENGVANMRSLEKLVLLQVIDQHWKEHLLNMDHLKEGISLRGYGQKNPLNEYKREGFEMFMDLMDTIKQQTIRQLFLIRLVEEDEIERLAREQRQRKQEMELRHGELEGDHQPIRREGDKIGRNSPCPCGSGNKYKKCCGTAS
jgi:preprotein translocase subunit SecA